MQLALAALVVFLREEVVVQRGLLIGLPGEVGLLGVEAVDLAVHDLLALLVLLRVVLLMEEEVLPEFIPRLRYSEPVVLRGHLQDCLRLDRVVLRAPSVERIHL